MFCLMMKCWKAAAQLHDIMLYDCVTYQQKFWSRLLLLSENYLYITVLLHMKFCFYWHPFLQRKGPIKAKQHVCYFCVILVCPFFLKKIFYCVCLLFVTLLAAHLSMETLMAAEFYNQKKVWSWVSFLRLVTKLIFLIWKSYLEHWVDEI